MSRKLNILFEAGPMVDRKKTGVGYYVQQLVDSVAEHYPDQLQLTGYYFNILKRNPKPLNQNPAIRLHEIWLMPGKILSLCRRLHTQPPLELFVRKRADIVLHTNYVSLPSLKKTKKALVVYDLSFIDRPEFTQDVNLAYLKRFCPPSIRTADLIITISEFTKDRLQTLFPDITADIIVTPIPPKPIEPAKNPVGQRLLDMGVKPQQYILYLGTIEPRKNLQNLIKAYSLFDKNVQSTYALVLAGGKGWKDEAIMEEVAAAKSAGLHIILTGYISDEERDALYTNASCFVLPSHYEGFGMPVLEAMQYKLPVAVSDIPVFHEVAGNAAVYFNKDEPADIAKTLQELLTDKPLRETIVSRADKQLASFSWQTNAERVFEAFKKLAQ